MKYRIKYLPETATDRAEIRTYLIQYYESTVRMFFALLKKKISRLKEFPYSCPIYEDDPDYRRMVVGDYLVFYMVNDDDKTVEIHRIFHGSQNISQHLNQNS
jgi:plasmid stabilization system protein ParE